MLDRSTMSKDRRAANFADLVIRPELSKAWQFDTLTTRSGSPGAGSLAIPACPTTDRRQFADVCRCRQSENACSPIFGCRRVLGVLVFSAHSDTQQFQSERDCGGGRYCRSAVPEFGRLPVRELEVGGTTEPRMFAFDPLYRQVLPDRCGAYGGHNRP